MAEKKDNGRTRRKGKCFNEKIIKRKIEPERERERERRNICIQEYNIKNGIEWKRNARQLVHRYEGNWRVFEALIRSGCHGNVRQSRWCFLFLLTTPESLYIFKLIYFFFILKYFSSAFFLPPLCFFVLYFIYFFFILSLCYFFLWGGGGLLLFWLLKKKELPMFLLYLFLIVSISIGQLALGWTIQTAGKRVDSTAWIHSLHWISVSMLTGIDDVSWW